MANDFNNPNNQQRPQGQQGVPQPTQHAGTVRMSRGNQPAGAPDARNGQPVQQTRPAPGAHPQQSANDSAKKPGGNKRTILIVVGCIMAALAVWLLVWLFACNGSNLFDSSARDGQAPYKTDEEIQAELNRVVEEGMFNISIASVIQFEDGQSNGTAYIENVPGNHYLMQVTITDDDSGDVLYESGVLKPNQFIENITLAKDLDAGTYSATATFKALDETTYDEVGQAAAKVTINVLN